MELLLRMAETDLCSVEMAIFPPASAERKTNGHDGGRRSRDTIPHALGPFAACSFNGESGDRASKAEPQPQCLAIFGLGMCGSYK